MHRKSVFGVKMVEAKDVRKMGHSMISIGLIFLMISMIVGIWIFYKDINDEIVEAHIVSAFNRFLYMNIIMIIIGVLGTLWSIGVEKGIHEITNGQLRSAQTSGVLLSIGTISTFVFGSAEVEEGALFGYVLFFIGLVMVAMGFIVFGKAKE